MPDNNKRMTIDMTQFPALAQINSPADLRQLPEDKLAPLCEELRTFLLHSVSRSSGHLASGLGVVELTVALHYVYQTPQDKLVWDVGHQAYPHKILTGRRERMETIRQKNGIHPFPWREESEYDPLSVGHSSTSIGAALGMAVAAKQQGLPHKVVAVIGDGALTAGMAFEALNHAGDLHEDMLVILNDNEMSISENVGALNNHLAKWLSGSLYTTLREGGKKVLSGLPPVKELARRAEEHIKGMVIPGTLFEELGFNYIGPIDGHDIKSLVKTLKNMRQLKGPQLLHVMTKKGKGYEPAEKDPIGYHGVPKFNPDDDCLPKNKEGKPTFSKIFGHWLCDMAEADSKLVGITPAMREGSGMVEFSQRYPERYFDVAIAEQHAVTFAAGLAIEGMKPVVAIYSSFMQRAYDQIIHDVAIQNLPVLFAIDRAGLVGADGPTHQGAFDISFLRTIPNMVIMTPSDENECRMMLTTGYQLNQPAAVRYPRGSGCGVTPTPELTTLPLGKGQIVCQGQGIALLCFGTLLHQAKSVAEKLDATLVDMRFVKPLDTELLQTIVTQHDVLVTIEENAIQGGAGSAVNEWMMTQRVLKPVLNIGLPDRFIEQGSQEEIYHDLKLDSAGIEQQIHAFMA
jgi:1-deoxy-D-xylulose-5-phosphate synthase